MGNARRGFFSGPGMENLDATSRASFRCERAARSSSAPRPSTCNHAQFFGPATVEGNISSGTFGQAVSAMPPR
jgi:hypothetical protein